MPTNVRSCGFAFGFALLCALVGAAPGMATDVSPNHGATPMGVGAPTASEIADFKKTHPGTDASSGASASAAPADPGGQPGSGAIGINSATPEQLKTLPGVGNAVAGRIIANRPYTRKAELLARKVVSRREFLKIRSKIMVDAPPPPAPTPAPPPTPTP